MTEPTIDSWIALPAGLLLIAGGLTTLIGALGLVRMPGFYARMHPTTMGATLGTACVVISSLLVSSSPHDILIVLFLLVTSPVSAITLMRAAISRARPSQR